MCKVLEFPKRKTVIDAETLENYVAVLEKKKNIVFRQDMILSSSNINRLFSGCHNAYGELPEKQYKLLLTFHNQPSLETWNMIKNIFIFGRVTPLDMAITYDIKNQEIDEYPSKADFMLYFSAYKQKTLLSNARLISDYDRLLHEIEIKYPEIKNIF